MRENERPLAKIEKYIMAWSIIGITVVMIFNVVARYFFNQSWTPTEEVCLTLVIISTFLGAGYAARRGEHLFVSVLFDLPVVPVVLKRLLALAISGICFAACLLIGWYGVKYVIGSYHTGRVTPSLGIPMYLIFLAFPTGFFMMAWQFFRNFRKNLGARGYYLGPDVEREGE